MTICVIRGGFVIKKSYHRKSTGLNNKRISHAGSSYFWKLTVGIENINSGKCVPMCGRASKKFALTDYTHVDVHTHAHILFSK